jgi:hypothetical protein
MMSVGETVMGAARGAADQARAAQGDGTREGGTPAPSPAATTQA